jgi:hypothetical protein
MHYSLPTSTGPIPKTVVLFLGQVVGHEIILSKEHKDFIWLPFEQAYNQLTFNNAQQALKAAQRWLIEKSC